MLSDETAGQQSQTIIRQVLPLVPWSDFQTVHIYQPIRKCHEVDTVPLLEQLGKYYPYIHIATWDMSKSARPISVWVENGQPAAGQTFDCIIVPTLGFNRDCYRIGFGGGVYDRFLAQQTQALTIGLCYETNQVSFIPEPHDIQLNYIVTEKTVYRPVS